MMNSVIMPVHKIHPTAIVHPNAVIGKNVEIGAYAIVGDDVVIGDGCKLYPHAVIHEHTTVGKNCTFFPGCSIGAVPQDLKFAGEHSSTIIGDGCIFRECTTVNRATGEGNKTIIGNNLLMMAYTHVAHNCIVGNNVIMSNVATLAGHVTVEDRAVIGGRASVLQNRPQCHDWRAGTCKSGRAAVYDCIRSAGLCIRPEQRWPGTCRYSAGRAQPAEKGFPHSVPQRAFFAGSNRNHGTGA